MRRTDASPQAAAVRVRTEVAALPKTFDYAVPPGWGHDVRVGSRVRVPLHGRSVRGWVVETDVATPPGVDLLPLKSWLGWGPPPPLVELTEWAAWRWAGPASFFLRVASAARVVRTLPGPPPAAAATVRDEGGAAALPSGWDRCLGEPGVTVVRLPPVTDLIDLVLAVVDDPAVRARGGSTVVLVPSSGWAERLTARLRRRGCAATGSWEEARAGWPVVVGSRAGAFAPVPRLAAAVVLDAHDAAYREESAPTYSAVGVLLERARREESCCLLASPIPPVGLAAHTGLRRLGPPVHEERMGWSTLERVDRRGADPRTGMFSAEFVRLARAVLGDPTAAARGPLVCVYNRTGGARLLACRHCGELARCTRCGAAAGRPPDEEVLACPRCGETRPLVCVACGRLPMKTLRAGVARLREELAALLGVEVGQVAGPRGGDEERPLPPAPVLVGTEAVLHRVRRAAAVAFLDIDLHLLAARLSATEDTLALLVRAARLVGARGSGPTWARVQVQTRVPEHPVLTAVARGEPEAALAEEVELRRASNLPPFSALALLSGGLAAAYAEALTREAGTVDGQGDGQGEVAVSPLDEGRFLLQAPGHGPLCDLLARTPRPAGRGLRVEVDPADL